MSKADPMKVLFNKIDKIAAKQRSRKTKYPHATVDHVSDLIKRAFHKKGSPEFARKEVNALKKEFTEHNDSHSKHSLRNFQCYNDFAEQLMKSHAAQCKFINTILKTERHLIIRLDKQTLSHIEYVLIIRDALKNMRTPPDLPKLPSTVITDKAGRRSDSNLLSNEIEYTCSFLASAVIFGLSTLPKFHHSLTRLRIKNIATNPVAIKLFYKSSDVFWRYFMPFPASAYFLRYILYHENRCRKALGRKVTKPNNFINQYSLINPDKMASYFTLWTTEVLLDQGIANSDGLTPPQFYKAALAASLLTSNFNKTQSGAYPPFILSAQSRKIKSYSFDDRYLYHLSSQYQQISGLGQPKRAVKKRAQAAISILHEAVDEIAKIRMPLEKIRHNLGYRQAEARRIIEAVERYKGRLNGDNFANLSLYGKWIAKMLCNSTSIKISAINDYASMVPSLLYNLSEEKAIYRLQPDKRDQYLRMTMREYRNRSIRNHLRYFCNFIASELKGKFKRPNWRKKDLQKEEIPTPKSLISFMDVDEALNRCEDHFKRHIQMKKDPDIIERETVNALHKTRVYRQIIALAFYTGLRISEIMRLRTNHIIYDDGIVLSIRSSKTRNGIRNIPLSLLMPDQVLTEFIDYCNYIWEKDPRYYNSPLFINNNLKVYSNTTVRKDVQEIFESLGYLEFVFHHLRHSFANWFLIRWFTAFHKNLIPPDTPFLKYDLFKPTYLDKIRYLVLGANSQKRGQKAFSYAMPALARLMGHGGPIVTLETYVHNPDWMFYLLSKHNEPKSVPITPKIAANFLQVTYPTLPPGLKGVKKTILSDALLNFQRDFLDHSY